MNALDLAEFRARLLARRAELVALDDGSREARATVELDQTRVGRVSRMDALQGQALAKATHGRRQAELRRIEAALSRLDAGDFGVCVTCGEDIAVKRLLSDPAVPTCIDCAAART